MTLQATETIPTQHVNADDIPWADWDMGWGVVGVKLLRVSSKSGVYSVLSKLPAGIVVPVHRHFGPVHGWVLEGKWRYLEYDWEATPGSYIYEPPGSVHTLSVEENMVTMFVLEGGQIMLGPNGELLQYDDFETVRDRYRTTLEAQGIVYPAALIEE